MAKLMMFGAEARAALARGVGKLAKAVGGTLGPRGLNAIIDRPVGTPIVSRDGVSIADEIELECRFENLGAQVVREVSKQTNEIAGDGTTTATVLADALIQEGVAAIANGQVSAADLIVGIDEAAEAIIDALARHARPLADGRQLACVTAIAATDHKAGAIVAKALEAVGKDGIVSTDQGSGLADELEVIEGFSFDRGYVSHHMVTDVENMRAVLNDAYILLTDRKITRFEQIRDLAKAVQDNHASLLIVAEDVDASVIAGLLALRKEGGAPVAVVNPPEFGHWRKAMLEDIGILTGGEVISSELGGTLEATTLANLGHAEQVVITQTETVVLRGRGEQAAIEARRAQIRRQFEAAPQNLERDKLEERLSKMTAGTARIFAGGATPAERTRRLHLLDNALAAGRAALQDGVVPGGGTALAQLAKTVTSRSDGSANDGIAKGIALFRAAMTQPVARIAENAGHDPQSTVSAVEQAEFGHGFDARNGQIVDMFEAGVIDPVRVTVTSVRNAVSSAKLILGTSTLIVDKPEYTDPTAGPARGGGAELLGRP
jgi:chaperonin GroEL